MEQVRNEPTIYSAAVYCRLSKDDENAGESVSIETQKRNGDGENLYRTVMPSTETYGQLNYRYEYDKTGNIIAVKERPTGGSYTTIETYEYDAWGNLISMTDGDGVEITSSTNIGNLNRIRCRGGTTGTMRRGSTM